MSAASTAHDMVQDLFRVRQELGRVPNRIEYQNHGKFPGAIITQTFGSFALFLKCAGLEYIKGKRDKQEIRRLHFEAVKKEEAENRAPVPPPLARNIIIIPDMHVPYHHPDAMVFLAELHKKYRFDKVVNTGDEIDGHAISFHTHDPDLLSPGHELDAAIKALEPLYKLFPEMDLAESNHGSLVYRRGKHFGLPRHVLKPYGEVLCAPPGYKWHHEVNIQMSNGKRLIVHHSYGQNALKESQHRGVSMFFGHHHSRFCIDYWENYEGLFFAGFAGSLVNTRHLAMEYGKNIAKRAVLGAVRIAAGIPQLLPMLLDRHGRWTGLVP